MSKIKQNILQKINQEKLRPHKRWFFVFRSLVLYFLLLISFIFAVAGFVLLIKVFFYTDFLFAELLSGGYIAHFAYFLGPVWLGVFIMTISFLQIQWWKTRFGHRNSIWKVVLVALLAVLFCAIGILYFGLDKNIQRMVMSFLPANVQEERVTVWHKPQKGILVVVPLEDVNAKDRVDKLKVIDIKGNQFDMNIDKLDLRDRVVLQIVPRFAVIGKFNQDGMFLACALKPLPDLGDAQNTKQLLEQTFFKYGVKNPKRNWFDFAQSETKENILRIYKCRQQ